MFVDSGVCFGFWEVFVPTSHGILIENNSFKDYLGPYKFHLFILFFVVL